MRLSTLVASVLVTLGGGAFADSIDDTVGPRALGMGDALQAAAFGSVSTSLNPAGLALTHQYEIEGSVGYRPTDSGMVLQSSVCDSVTTKVGACVSYKRLTASPSDSEGEKWERTMNQGALTLAVPLGTEVAIGLTGRYVTYSETLGTRTVMPPNSSLKGIVLDAGATFKPIPSLTIGGVGYNLIGGNNGEFPRSLGAGLSFTPTPKLMLNGDGRWSLADKTARYSAGAEYFVATSDGQQGFPIRAGFLYDTTTKGSYLSAGGGYMTQRVGIDVGLRKQVGGVGDELSILAAIRLFLPN
jgi:hypothetical protein